MKSVITAVTAASLGALLIIPSVAQDSTTEQMKNAPPAVTEPNSMTTVGTGEKMTTGQISTSALLNKSVLNEANESIGDVNDVILEPDGKVASVIIGVGGFLGMGEKDVALPFDKLTIGMNKDNDLVVKTGATKEMLQSAPQYMKPGKRR